MTDIPTSERLAAITDDDLSAELARRNKERIDAHWERAKKNAQYLCPDCGMPDGWHTKDCISDMGPDM